VLRIGSYYSTSSSLFSYYYCGLLSRASKKKLIYDYDSINSPYWFSNKVGVYSAIYSYFSLIAETAS
jgi:hypothetical protein